MLQEDLEVVCDDGWRLRGELLLPDSAPRAVAIVGHAMMVDRRTLDRPRGAGLVSRLVEHGLAVVWPDLRGHGRSGPRAEAGGRWCYDDLVDHDVPSLLAWTRARLPGVRCVAVGHSLFGHVTLAHLTRHPEAPLDGLVLIACNYCHPEWGRRRLAYVERGVMIGVMAGLAHAFGRFPTRRLRFGSDDEATPFVDDFVRGWSRLDWRARDGFSYAANRARVRTPVLSLLAAGDRHLAPPDEARTLVTGLTGPVRVEVCGRASGLPFDPDHMGIVIDPRARPVWDRAAAFALDVSAPRAAGAASPSAASATDRARP
jgi:predicted alpha/beta hydrolase